jgi:hypothetical protein
VLRLLTCLGAFCLLVAGAGLALAARGVETDSAARPRSAPPPIPARMLGPEVPVPISPSILRERNGWLVSDGRTLVAVYAGTGGNDPSVGRLVIVRQDLVAGRQRVRTLDAGPTGALAIAAAPLGSSVETSAQRGIISLRAAGGPVLRLDLGAGTLTRRSRSVASVPRPWPPRSSDSASDSSGR